MGVWRVVFLLVSREMGRGMNNGHRKSFFGRKKLFLGFRATLDTVVKIGLDLSEWKSQHDTRITNFWGGEEGERKLGKYSTVSRTLIISKTCDWACHFVKNAVSKCSYETKLRLILVIIGVDFATQK